MTAPTLNSLSLGNVDTISFEKNEKVSVYTTPQEDSSETLIGSYQGVAEMITIMGNFTGSSVSVVKTLIDAIRALIDGDQENTINFVSDEMGTVSVIVIGFSVVWNVPSNNANYSLKLQVGKTIT